MPAPRLRALVVDDAPDHAEIARRALAKAGCDVVVAHDAAAGLARLREGRFHLLVTDLRMPGGDGDALARAARAAVPDLRIVVASASEADEDVARARACGADAFLPKSRGGAYAAALAALPGFYLNPLRRRPRA